MANQPNSIHFASSYPMIIFPTLHVLFVVPCLLLSALNLASCKSDDTPSCFVAQHPRIGDGDVCHYSYRRSTAASSMVLTGRETNAIPGEKYYKKNHAPSQRLQERTKQKTNGHRDEAHQLTKLKMKDALLVEKLLCDAVDKMNRSNKQTGGINGINMPPSKLFPSVRQCNAALATFGDAGEFRRALKLFTQMKNSFSLFSVMSQFRVAQGITYGGRPIIHSIASDNSLDADNRTKSEKSVDNNHRMLHSIDLVHEPPKPTLVTYSTLMSRAVSLGKPRVALRLWKLMQNQPNFYTKQRNGRMKKMQMANQDPIVPDVIFCNTLMNAYAKLGDHVSARSILNAMRGSKGVACHESIPDCIVPTVVTYNTLADACKVAGELGAALEVPELMTAHADATGDASLLPDARTYTILISTVARKKLNDTEVRDVRSGGEKDPDMAFALLNRMIREDITPNGVTYCALIDVCSRCRRNDLALNGLRIMLKQKSISHFKGQLFNEVGAWTSAINCCGRTGRTDTAIRLFRSMQKAGVKPNAVTCGCLSDCLLKAMRVTDTIEVMQYMNREGLAPSVAQYTSLMGIALRIAERENKSKIRKGGLELQIIDKCDEPSSDVALNSDDSSASEAIKLYTTLMGFLIHDGNEDMLLKVFLVFQEMKNAGVKPDAALYNLLLRACALSGDIEKTQDVIKRMNADGIEPNPKTWRGALNAARIARRSDIADVIWNAAATYQNKDVAPFVPNVSDVELLLSVYVSELANTSNHGLRSVLNRKIIALYEGITSRSKDKRFQLLNIEKMERNQQFMISVLRAAVSYELHGPSDNERTLARNLACDIAGLEMFQRRMGGNIDRATKKALQKAHDWLNSY